MLYFAFWFLISCAMVAALPAMSDAAAVLIAMLLPQITRLKDSRIIDIKFAEKFPKFFQAIQYHDELTRKYFTRIISREERRATFRALEVDPKRRIAALDRLYEHYLLDIVSQLSKTARNAQRKRVRQIARVGPHYIKCRFLMRHLGYTEFNSKLRAIASNPRQILPTWPPEAGNRRRGGDRRRECEPHQPDRRVIHPHGRRQLDDPASIEMLLRDRDG
jgi:hypothetical protein